MMRRCLVVLGLLILPMVAYADRIHLENGKSFDDVVLVSQTRDQVRFRVASGVVSLPSSLVARIERAPGALEEYLGRHESLAADPAAPAEAWLALARWARTQGLTHGFREALLVAGELEPELSGLAPLMAKVGYHLDPGTNVWGDRRPAEPTKVRAESDSARPPRVESAPPERGDQRIAEGLTRAIETLAQAELQRTRARSVASESAHRRPSRARTAFYPLVSVPVAYTVTGWVFPGVPLRSPDSDPGNPVVRSPANPHARALLSRPPGSLLPVSAYRH